MRQVFKYRLNDPGVVTELEVRAELAPALVAEQRQQGHIWLEVAEVWPVRTRRFIVLGTGWDIPAAAKHVGSYQSMGGVFIWHVYELTGSAV